MIIIPWFRKAERLNVRVAASVVIIKYSLKMTLENMIKMNFEKIAKAGDPATVCDFLASCTTLPKEKIKDAISKGATWIKPRDRRRQLRVRKATAPVSPGDRISLFYDEKVLLAVPPKPECLADYPDYSIWYKPPGLMSQGTQYGDHCSLLRYAELFFKPRREVFPVHRLDREASGLVIVAHTTIGAAQLSGLFQQNRIVKRYRTEVLGNLADTNPRDTISLPLDGKPAITEYETVSYDPERNTSVVDVTIKTGRFHQIRRHFDMIGFPVMGDPRYGTGNKNSSGMKLEAVSLEFRCPFGRQQVRFSR